jgi:hypothetical protein
MHEGALNLFSINRHRQMQEKARADKVKFFGWNYFDVIRDLFFWVFRFKCG